MKSWAFLLTLAGAYAAPSYYDGYETVDSPTEPVQMRIAFNGPFGVTISWNTFEKINNPTVRFAEEPIYLYRTASSSDSTTYPTSLTYNNHVELNGLLPDTQYYVSLHTYPLQHEEAPDEMDSTSRVDPTRQSHIRFERPSSPVTRILSRLLL